MTSTRTPTLASAPEGSTAGTVRKVGSRGGRGGRAGLGGQGTAGQGREGLLGPPASVCRARTVSPSPSAAHSVSGSALWLLVTTWFSSEFPTQHFSNGF